MANVIDLCGEGLCCEAAAVSFERQDGSRRRAFLCKQHHEELLARAYREDLDVGPLDLRPVAMQV